MHYRNMSKKQLLRLVEAMGWAALDLGQHLNFTNDWLKPEYQKEAYKNAETKAYEISRMGFDFEPVERGNVDITVLDHRGATNLNTTLGANQ